MSEMVNLFSWKGYAIYRDVYSVRVYTLADFWISPSGANIVKNKISVTDEIKPIHATGYL